MSTTLSTKLLRALGLVAFAAPTLLVGCAKPAATTPPEAEDAGVGADADAPNPQEVVRTVEQRSPFGNLDVPDNLVLDGDFEFTGRSGQMPWLAFGGMGQGTLNFATGGLCRSGVRCASLTAGSEMIGWMASPKSGGMNVSLWAKPPSGNCADLRVFVTDIEGQADGDGLRAETTKAGEGGWCRYEVDAANYAGMQPVLYVSTASSRVQGPILVDDAVARALPATLKRTLAMKPTTMDAASKARVRFIGDWVRTHRIYGLPARESVEGPSSKLVDAPRTTIR
jgi:hypothetical protein